ncbi:MAG: DUF1634 domain-containing protein [Phycisphaerales bacterium]|nr:DUF1634 domain-containing protein [Phycisphaerales bacterium]
MAQPPPPPPPSPPPPHAVATPGRDAPGNTLPARDRRFDMQLSRVLIWGTMAAGAVIAISAIVLVATQGRSTVRFTTFDPGLANGQSVAKVIRGVAALDPRSLLLLGVIMVIATPVLRVAFSLVTFAIERDRLYVLITAVVLAVLGYSLFFAR